MAAEAWTLLTGGQFVEAVLSVYTEAMGFWFFILMYALIVVMVYLKTETVTTPLIVSLLFNGIIIFMAPAGSAGVSELLTLSWVLFASSAGGIVYKIYKGR